MKYKVSHIFILASLLLTSVACSDTPLFYEDSNGSDVLTDGKVEVSFPISTTISMSTRTQIDPDDLTSVRWSVGDQVNLWAEGLTNSNSDLAAEMFELKAFSSTYQVARFSGAITPMEADQEYKYSAFYPYTSSVSGKVVNVELPSAQTGDYEGAYDLRVADVTKGEVLLSSGDNDGFNLAFRSVMHILRITIPEGYNSLGVPVKSMTITMPTDVVGSLSLDISDPTATPQIVSGGSSVITVDLSDDPITDGDGRYVWLFIKPISNVTGDIKIGCIGVGGEYTYNYSIPVTDHTFAAGRITPINSEICEEMPATTLRIAIGENNLGEELTNINVTAPAGAIFIDSGTNSIVIENDGSGYYDMSYITELYGDKFKAGSLSVEFESNQALIPIDDISLSSIAEDTTNTFTRTVPYILYEDFSDLSSYSQDGGPPVGSYEFSSGDKDYIDLSTKGLSYTGWCATRSSSDGNMMRICGRWESLASYPARLNSPELSYLKSGAKIVVTYNNKGEYYARYSYVFGWGNSKDSSVKYQRGYFTGDNPDADNDISYMIDSSGAVVTSDGDIKLSTTWTSSTTYTTNNTETFTVSGVSGETRLAWRAWCDDGPGTGNGNYYVYLDNVKVQVVP